MRSLGRALTLEAHRLAGVRPGDAPLEVVFASAIVALGGCCARCREPAHILGLWSPSDPTLIGNQRAVVFASCGECGDEEMEEFLAGREARTS